MEKMSKIEELSKAYSSYLSKVHLTSIGEPDDLSSDPINLRYSVLAELKNRIAKKLQALDQAYHYYIFFGQFAEFDKNISLLGDIDDSCFMLIQQLSNQIISSCSEENQEEEVVEE